MHEPTQSHGEHPPPDMTAVFSRVSDLQQQARDIIRERPVVAVLAAMGLGFLVARMASRLTR